MQHWVFISKERITKSQDLHRGPSKSIQLPAANDIQTNVCMEETKHQDRPQLLTRGIRCLTARYPSGKQQNELTRDEEMHLQGKNCSQRGTSICEEPCSAFLLKDSEPGGY